MNDLLASLGEDYINKMRVGLSLESSRPPALVRQDFLGTGAAA
jgi:hypothetical protein